MLIKEDASEFAKLITQIEKQFTKEKKTSHDWSITKEATVTQKDQYKSFTSASSNVDI